MATHTCVYMKEDVSPEDTQMLQWVEEAAQCNNFRVVDAEGRPTATLTNHLLQEYPLGMTADVQCRCTLSTSRSHCWSFHNPSQVNKSFQLYLCMLFSKC